MQRDSNGLFLKGNTIATGRPKSVFQGLSDRRSHFLQTLSRGEILAIAADPEKLDEYSSFDSMVLIGLAEAMQLTPEEKLDPAKARENLYDRELGRATQKTELTGKDGGEIVMARHFNESDLDTMRRYFEKRDAMTITQTPKQIASAPIDLCKAARV